MTPPSELRRPPSKAAVTLEINKRRRAHDITADCAKRLSERALDDGRAVHDAVALGDVATARAVEADRMYLVEISHRVIADGRSRRHSARQRQG
jgi:hypothetical protein